MSQLLKYQLIEFREKIRDKINHNPRMIFGITLICVFVFIVTAFGLLAGRNKRPRPASHNKVWFYDSNTGKLFAAAPKHSAAIEDSVVRAYVFTYVNEPNENQLYIGYLTKPDLDSKSSDSKDQSDKPFLVRTINDANWFSEDSPQGRQIIRTALQRDETGRIPRYWPPK
ncbi:MAG: hypothetical protein WCZ89_05085 [Phycisphaerae bacterium]